MITKNLILFNALIFIFISIFITETSFATNTKTIDNPQQFVVEQTKATYNTNLESLTEFDCTTEDCKIFIPNILFIAPKSSCGNAGCEYYIFKYTISAKKNGSNNLKQYYFVTNFFMHSKGFSFLKSSHNNMNDIEIYLRNGASNGEYITYIFDGKNYKEHSRHK